MSPVSEEHPVSLGYFQSSPNGPFTRAEGPGNVPKQTSSGRAKGSLQGAGEPVFDRARVGYFFSGLPLTSTSTTSSGLSLMFSGSCAPAGIHLASPALAVTSSVLPSG